MKNPAKSLHVQNTLKVHTWLYCSLNHDRLLNQKIDCTIFGDETMVLKTLGRVFFSIKSIMYQAASAIAQAENITQR